MSDFDDLTDSEKRDISNLKRNFWPNDQLENDLVVKLKSLGLIRQQRPKLYLYWPISIAASLLFFFIGTYWNVRPESPQYNYILLLHNTEDFSNAGTVREYAEWMNVLQRNGLTMDGEKLHSIAQLATYNAINEVDQSKHSDYISGYFLLKANTREEALEIIRSSPHVKYGGTIELRQIVKN